jgi:hypothetical protein
MNESAISQFLEGFRKGYARGRNRCDDPWEDAPLWAVELRNMMSIIINKENKMSAELDALTAAVAAEDTVIDSAVALINGIPALIAAAGTDPAKLSALSADITAKSAALAAAVAANTPAAVPTPAADA